VSPYRTDPLRSGRHPFQLFVLFLAWLVSLPTLFGAAPTPGSINATLPAWLAFSWSVALAAGAGIALVGVFLLNRPIGIILEQLGLGIFGIASVVYTAAALKSLGLAALQPAGIVAGFGAACLWRYFQLQGVLNRAQAEQKRRDDRG